MLVKVQIDDTGKSVLVYNEDRTLITTFESEQLLSDLGPQMLPAKYFMEAKQSESGAYYLDLETILPPDQWPDW